MSGKIIAVLFAEGGMGDVGKHVVSAALNTEGVAAVRGIARAPDTITSTESVTKPNVSHARERISFVALDPCTELAQLSQALHGADAVVQCVGCRQLRKERWAAAATRNTVEACAKAGVQRLVMISSEGIGDSWPPMQWHWLVGRLFSAMMLTVLKQARRDLNAAEEAVTSSGLDYLIVRPTGLTPTAAATGVWKLRASKADGPVDIEIPKEDCAQFMLQEALEPTLHRAAVTIGGPPKGGGKAK